MALLKLALVFGGIVLLLTQRWNLGLVLYLASLAIGLLFGHPLLAVGQDVLLAAVEPVTLTLILIVVLIMTLGGSLHHSAATQRMVQAMEALIPNGRIVIAAIPAMLGLLPVAGGAMLSAPMVEEVGERLKAEPARKMFINYWYRHIWEPTFPLYPSMVLAAALLELSPLQLAAATWPLVVVAAIVGIPFGLLGMPRRGDGDPHSVRWTVSVRTLAESMWPVVLVIALALMGSVWIEERVSLILSLLAALTLMVLLKRLSPQILWKIWRNEVRWEIVLVILGAFAFRRVLEGSGAIIEVSQELTALQIPLFVVAFAIPFLTALLTGLTAASFSIGFPLVLPLVVGNGTISPDWALWLMASGVAGLLCSPIHLCLALTRVYYEAQWGALYRRLIPAVFLVVLAAAGMFWFL